MKEKIHRKRRNSKQSNKFKRKHQERRYFNIDLLFYFLFRKRPGNNQIRTDRKQRKKSNRGKFYRFFL